MNVFLAIVAFPSGAIWARKEVVSLQPDHLHGSSFSKIMERMQNGFSTKKQKRVGRKKAKSINDLLSKDQMKVEAHDVGNSLEFVKTVTRSDDDDAKLLCYDSQLRTLRQADANETCDADQYLIELEFMSDDGERLFFSSAYLGDKNSGNAVAETMSKIKEFESLVEVLRVDTYNSEHRGKGLATLLVYLTLVATDVQWVALVNRSFDYSLLQHLGRDEEAAQEINGPEGYLRLVEELSYNGILPCKALSGGTKAYIRAAILAGFNIVLLNGGRDRIPLQSAQEELDAWIQTCDIESMQAVMEKYGYILNFGRITEDSDYNEIPEPIRDEYIY